MTSASVENGGHGEQLQLPEPFAAIASSTAHRLVKPRLELHSFFFACFSIFCIFFTAYLSNPTEASFRTFVTELAFRRHITKLSGGQLSSDDSTTGDVNPSSGLSPSRGGRRQADASSTPSSVTPNGPGFHFSNRANISLRTPAHVFRSFLFFTIVIVTPVSNSKASASDAHPGKDRSGGKPVSSAATLEGSWYIGAFGQWWLAGTLEFPKTLSRKPPSAKEQLLGDEAAISPFDQKGGVLSMKSLDRGAPLRSAVPSTPLVKLSPVKPAAAAANGKVKRRRSVARKSNPQGCNTNASDDEGTPIRSTTPPPLPQSVSLPLHSTRLPPTQATQHPLPCATRTAGVERVRLTPSKPTSASYSHGTALPSQSSCSPQLRKSPSQHLATLDQHPAVIEVLNQIKSTESHLSELQSQFTSFTTTASAQRQILQQTLDESREKKVQDDKTRAESKSRLKSLEDSRQTAELSKRGVEKRLKGVQTQYDLALHRIEQLEEEIQELQKVMAEDESRVIQSGIEASETEVEMGRKIAAKKRELALAEELVTKLETRAQELECSIDEAKAKLAKAKADADEKQKSRVSLLLQQRPSAARSRPSSGQFGPPSGSSNDLALAASIAAHRSPGQFAFPPANPPGPPPHARQHAPVQSSILQRRKIPATAEPEPLQLAKPGPTAGPSPDDPPVTAKSMRPRAASLSGNTTVIVDTTGIPGFAAVGPRNVGGVTPSSGVGVIGRGPPPRIGSNKALEMDSLIPPASAFARRMSTPSAPRHPSSTFRPFGDSDSESEISLQPGTSRSSYDDGNSLSTFATSLLPQSLVKSIEGDNSALPSPAASRPSSNSFAHPYAMQQSSDGSPTSHRRSFSWGRWGGNNGRATVTANGGVVLQQFSPHSTDYSSPDLSVSSPISFGSSNGGRFSDRYDHPVDFSPSISSGSASQHSFERYPSSAAPPPMETVDEDKASKYRRWFPYFINSQAAQLAVFPRSNEFASVQSSAASTKSSKSKSGLNPDAKVFTFSRSRNSLHVSPPASADPTKAGETGNVDSSGPSDIQPNTAQIPHPSFASRMYGSLGFNHRPTAQTQGAHEDATASGTPTGNFFSSLLAFAPSPAERRALQRSLERSKEVVNNGSLGTKGSASREVLPISPFASPLPSAQSSAVDLHHTPSAASAPWDREIQGKAPNSSEVSPPKSSPVEKRTFSSLWLRNKAARTSNSSLTSTDVVEKDKDSKAPENKALDTVTGVPSEIENPVFGGRFRFTRQKSGNQENPVTSKE
ncbi:hypothetical protein M407DRAFT_155326 [Tulasnella calospora MUT 4182]|uniref:Proteophosphoglycan ppg4 n=1 Tax=Tulasnella calospora MUT 4182 TaxID=1051891 RepID=A0A0C3QRF0_9AGAM|nr:hypothetical protein M407DRAFT_155326 [Tulasnella calospora MUT 4182]